MHKGLHIISLISIAGVATFALLAVITQIGVFVIGRQYPAQGKFVEVSGSRMHVIDIGPRDAQGQSNSLPIVLIHGATSNLGSMRVPVGDMLAKNHRVILIDRPGHGWSTRDDLRNSSPAMQARQIDETLAQLGIERAIIVVHSLAGVLGARMALDYPQRVAGLMMLAGVSYPWPGGVGAYNDVVTTPVVGPLLAYTITLPLGYFLTEPGTRSVFLPQTMPDGYVHQAMIPLVLRPREFLANAWDLVTLKAAAIEQSPRYAEIRTPTVVIAGDTDSTVSPEIHSRRFAATVPNAKLIVLPNVGHMVQNAAPDLVVREIEGLLAAAAAKPTSAMR